MLTADSQIRSIHPTSATCAYLADTILGEDWELPASQQGPARSATENINHASLLRASKRVEPNTTTPSSTRVPPNNHQ